MSYLMIILFKIEGVCAWNVMFYMGNEKATVNLTEYRGDRSPTLRNPSPNSGHSPFHYYITLSLIPPITLHLSILVPISILWLSLTSTDYLVLTMHRIYCVLLASWEDIAGYLLIGQAYELQCQRQLSHSHSNNAYYQKLTD
ncbi:hypothetical protein BOTNAR_0129g00110 [Botryotinia narcissicola]|uniref:Uncharacterized protein n=1 Tax=Botryotinia narcissicola TaxID=278944 RepID=A0A4Z1IQ35_9HELO|nr:hypothetical protein BOTNAR_0129g00110 [Botryotinia narcissicola]